MTKQRTALVIGAGAFGTALASVLSHNFDKVFLKLRSPELYDSLLERKENPIYLPGIKLEENIIPIMSFDDMTNSNPELIILGLPSSAITSFTKAHGEDLRRFLEKGIPVVSLAKGIDVHSLKLVDELLDESYGEFRDLFFFLSGPSFAREILEKQITTVTLAGRDRTLMIELAHKLHTPFFKVFLSYDIKGVLLGGALKNVLTIAGGIVEGLGYNHNTRAALITQGINEMLRFGKVFNARPETFYGLSGMGDLILSTTGDISRNKLFGLSIAKGQTPEMIQKGMNGVVEGYKTTKAVHRLAQKYHIRNRIFSGLYFVLYEGADPRAIMQEIMDLPPKFEI